MADSTYATIAALAIAEGTARDTRDAAKLNLDKGLIGFHGWFDANAAW